MNLLHATTKLDKTESLLFSRERDRRIVWLLNDHPVTARQLVEIGWFPQVTKARKRLRRLSLQKKIRCVGSVHRKWGRPEWVYARWHPKADDLLHEIELTDVCFCLNVDLIERGSKIQSIYQRPDARLTLNQEILFLEYDRGTMSLSQMQARFQKYQGIEQVSLWVCQNQQRVEQLRVLAQPIRQSALFTTVNEIRTAPRSAIWVDVDGNRVELPFRSGSQSGSDIGS